MPQRLVIFRWSRQYFLYQLDPVALDGAGRPVAYYGYPPGPIADSAALRWYPLAAESASP
ncbi:MAG: hypothetical protein K6U14_10935 [Firmicutes bacterium]|nr:hypothetical protein [Alicyclobacillaceae bacterium]MCL6498127.1 hypothetical protein [Bacillota bacterium]